MILMTAVLCLGGMTNAPAAPTSNAAVTSAPVREGAVTVRETVAETIAHHRGLKVIQERLQYKTLLFYFSILKKGVGD